MIAFRCLRGVSRLVKTQHRQIARSFKQQATFKGLRVVAVYSHNNGFGYDSQGDLVIVSPAIKGTEEQNFSAIQSTVHTRDEGAESVPFFDGDLWCEGRTDTRSIPSSRGNAPWAKPHHFRPRPYCGSAAAYSSLSGDGQSSGSSSIADVPLSLVIFDKDGTLIDVNSVWLKWMENYVVELEEATGLDLADRLYSAVGYCPTKNEYKDDGLLALATIADITDKIKEVLVEAGIEESEADSLVDKCCQDFDTGGEDMLEPLGNLTNIFKTLKSRGIKTAVCTADSRSGTMTALHRLGLTEMVDKIVCGDDNNSTPKPAPDNALHICNALDVPPSRTAVIGDTTADTGMGRSAGLGMTIGVLSGAGSKTGLEKDADVILSSVDEILGIVLPDEYRTSKQK